MSDYVPIQTGPDGKPVYVPPPVTMPLETARRFIESVEGLFKDDPNWSVLDLDGAKEFYAACEIIPDVDAATVGTD